MSSRPTLCRLLQTASSLHPVQVGILLDVAHALSRPVEEELNPTSDIATPGFSISFRNRLLLHHATTEAKLTKKPFEYAFAAACLADGRQARVVSSQTNPGVDVIVDGRAYSLKTEAWAGIRPNLITISKLSEARWIQQCSSLDELVRTTVARVVDHLRQYERILTLRARGRPDGQVVYQLVEIPLPVLFAIGTLQTSDFTPRTGQGGSTAKVRVSGEEAFTLRLDGSDGKITLTGLRLELCVRHATWAVPAAAPPTT